MKSAMGEKSTHIITRDRYDAVLFDLDGVLTDTAKLHAECWKQMFDEYLQKRATQRGEAFRPFGLANDYRLYVMGSPVSSTESGNFAQDCVVGLGGLEPPTKRL
jgi:phosphoglycolate phosphatase-like HAD superfamily hydrolase